MKIAKCVDGLYAVVMDNHPNPLCDAPKGATLDEIDSVVLTKHLNGKVTAKLDKKLQRANLLGSKVKPEYVLERWVKKVIKIPLIQSSLLIGVYHLLVKYL